MRQTKKIIFISILSLLFSACIEPFNPDITGQNEAKHVVYGQITDQEGFQTVSISMSATIEKPKYVPLTNCSVKITDNRGNVFNLLEKAKGEYTVWMKKEDLTPGISFKLNIITDSGVEIESNYEQMPECPEIDSIYYKRKDILRLQGIQFYADVDGRNTNSKYYRWDIVETWEHHAAYPKTWFWNKFKLILSDPPDYSRFYCWTTEKIKKIFTLSTEELTQNSYKMFPFHFVDNLSQRLTYCYSINVTQYSLTKSAYTYWNNLRINSNNQGGLYNTQPLNIKGNLKSTSNSELEILGFFTASSARTKRIFVQNVEDLKLYYIQCEGRSPERGDFNRGQEQYAIGPFDDLKIVTDECIECDFDSGNTTKPDYWPY